MGSTIAWFLIGIGVCLFLAGVLLSRWEMPSGAFLCGSCGAVLAGLLGCWRGNLREWRRERQRRRAAKTLTPLAQEYAPILAGDYTPDIIEAADRLGAARDLTAVPYLIIALERYADTQPPGWREVSETIVRALQAIGDGRALPVLYRLENVRGIGFITNIRSAIAAIEPQSSLLRAGGLETPSESLLRAAASAAIADDPRVLLRANSE